MRYGNHIDLQPDKTSLNTIAMPQKIQHPGRSQKGDGVEKRGRRRDGGKSITLPDYLQGIELIKLYNGESAIITEDFMGSLHRAGVAREFSVNGFANESLTWIGGAP